MLFVGESKWMSGCNALLSSCLPWVEEGNIARRDSVKLQINNSYFPKGWSVGKDAENDAGLSLMFTKRKEEKKWQLKSELKPWCSLLFQPERCTAQTGFHSVICLYQRPSHSVSVCRRSYLSFSFWFDDGEVISLLWQRDSNAEVGEHMKGWERMRLDGKRWEKASLHIGCHLQNQQRWLRIALTDKTFV